MIISDLSYLETVSDTKLHSIVKNREQDCRGAGQPSFLSSLATPLPLESFVQPNATGDQISITQNATASAGNNSGSNGISVGNIAAALNIAIIGPTPVQ
jgi:hypothetical protein